MFAPNRIEQIILREHDSRNPYCACPLCVGVPPITAKEIRHSMDVRRIREVRALNK